jgi:hypothetical protein
MLGPARSGLSRLRPSVVVPHLARLIDLIEK